MFTRLLLGTALGCSALVGTHAVFMLHAQGKSLVELVPRTIDAVGSRLQQPGEPAGEGELQVLLDEVCQAMFRPSRDVVRTAMACLAIAACEAFVLLRALPLLPEFERRLVFVAATSLLPWLGVQCTLARDTVPPGAFPSAFPDLVGPLVMAIVLAVCIRPKVVVSDVTSRTRVAL
jgi:hypothetical protein